MSPFWHSAKLILKIKKSLPSARQRALGKEGTELKQYMHYRRCALYRVLKDLPRIKCRAIGEDKILLSATLDKIKHLVIKYFIERQILDIKRHLAKDTLPSTQHRAPLATDGS